MSPIRAAASVAIADEIEKLAAQTVLLIQGCVDVLRNVFDTNCCCSPKIDLDREEVIGLWGEFHRKSSLPTQMQTLYQQSLLVAKRWKTIDPQRNHSNHSCRRQEEDSYTYAKEALLSTQEGNDDDRSRIFCEIVIPSLETLSLLYEILDDISTTPPISLSSESESSNAGKNHNKPTKPPVPIGMLSIQNYTDVACWVEWIVCTFLLPCLPKNVLLDVPERVRYQLSKVLRKRLPSSSFSWGIKYVEQQQQQQSSSPSSSIVTNRILQEIQIMVHIVGRLLLLDRFRPMLLPTRHLIDLYAGILFVHHLQQQQQQQQQQQIDVHFSWFEYTAQRFVYTTITNSTKNNTEIDPLWQARACQSLLRRGQHDTPVWLRRSVSCELAHLARTNLAAVIAVFVNDTTSARRLARVLVSVQATINSISVAATTTTTVGPAESSQRQFLCHQIVNLLDSIVMQLSPTPQQQSITLQTIWAILDLLSATEMQYLQGLLVLYKDENDNSYTDKVDEFMQLSSSRASLHRIVQRLGVLLSVQTPTTKAQLKVVSWFWDPVPNLPIPSLIGVMIRMAVARPIVLHSQIRHDVLWTLHLWVDTMLKLTTSTTRSEADGPDIAAIALILALVPCEWDLQMYSFTLDDCNQSCSTNTCDNNEKSPNLSIVRRDASDECDSLDMQVKGIEERATLVVKQLLLRQDSRQSEPTSDRILGFIFQTLLLGYLSTNGSIKNDKTSSLSLPPPFLDSAFEMVPLVCLPLLCELSQPDSLLSFVEKSDGILEIMKIVFECARDRLYKQIIDDTLLEESTSSQSFGTLATPTSSLDLLVKRFYQATITVQPPNSSICTDTSPATRKSNRVFADDEMLTSMAAILLGLFIGMLELEPQNRTPRNDELHESFSEVIHALSMCSTIGHSHLKCIVAIDEITELASYAMILIVSRRSCSLNDTTERKQDSVLIDDPHWLSVQQAEEDLASIDPPIRARGMMTLRQVANSLGEQSILKERNIIVSIETRELRKKDDDLLLLKMLKVAVDALADSESYVYLASIHTIVAIANASPGKIIPIIGFAIASGTATKLQEVGTMSLTLEQRAKLTEACTFIIRRRGSFDRELPILFDILVFGPRDEDQTKIEEPMHLNLIHQITHEYFVNDSNANDDSDYWKEVDIRVRTGGPLFATEEGDVVRAERLVVVSELVTILPPVVVARQCPLLIGCCVSTLRLDVSRPLLRAAALLARQLYATLVREMDSLLDAGELVKDSDVPMAKAMISGGQDILEKLIQHCVDNSHKKEEICHDPATIARCHEALALLSEAKQGGMLIAGELALESHRRNNNPVARLLQETKSNDLVTYSKFKGIVELEI